ncbi:unnamed protein product [Urochloa decumbens]|uniref:Late embryogenesis abundant protein LEA-2 subgroup domain-containing protein n=1 Tax=Urochloa decumbens TaxID=240449 RepID=A0ABC8YNX9_9POAL
MTMATHEHKIDHLDQPYYGPPILPGPAHGAAAGVEHPPRRGRDTYALFCRAFRALTLVLIALGVVALVLWLVYQPSSLKAHVDFAQLTRFDLAVAANGTRLRFDLTVGVSIRNPNRKQAVLFRRLEAVALYGGERFGHADLSSMRQPRKSTAELPRGEVAVVSGGAAATLFAREKEEGFFGIGVKLRTRVRLNVAVRRGQRRGFTPTQCHVDDFS